jgi:hypothetical protein
LYRLRSLGINSFLTKLALPSAVIGFILVRIYFWQVEYVSALQFKDLFSTGILAFVLVSAMIGSVVACFLVPTFFLFEIVLGVKDAGVLKLITIENEDKSVERGENAKKAAFFCLITLFLPWLVASSLVLTLPDKNGESLISWGNYKWAITFAFLVVIFVYLKSLLKDQKLKWYPDLFRYLLLLAPSFPLVYAFIALVPLLHFSNLSNDELTPLKVFGYFAVFGFFVSFVNFILLAGQRNAKKIDFWTGAVALSFVAITMMCGLLESSARLNIRLMELASIRVPNVSLVLNADGCNLMKARGYVQDDEIPFVASAAAGECVIHGVTALVTISSDWWVECGPIMLAQIENERRATKVALLGAKSGQCAFSLPGKSILTIAKNTSLFKLTKKP